MKLLIAGSRTLDPKEWVSKISQLQLHCIDWVCEPTEYITGACSSGIDQCAKMLTSPRDSLTEFPASWEEKSRAGGPMRNRKMAEYCDAAIIIWDGQSAGTRNMIVELEKIGKPFILYNVGREVKRNED